MKTFPKGRPAKRSFKVILCGLLVMTQLISSEAANVLIDDDFEGDASLITGDFFRVRTRYSIDPGDPGRWVEGAGSWSLTGGALQNTASTDDSAGEAGLGMVVDVRSITNIFFTKLDLSFDYSLGDAGESLYLHVWGVVNTGDPPVETGGGLTANDMIAHVGYRQNGSFEDFTWQNSESLPDVLQVWNLLNGTNTVGRPDIRPQDAIELTGAAGSQSYSGVIDLSSYSLNNISEYDYVLVGFSRNVAGASSAVTIDNVLLSDNNAALLSVVPEPSSTALLGLGGVALLLRRRRA